MTDNAFALTRRGFITAGTAAGAISALPAQARVSPQPIRICGSDRMAPLVDAWTAGFRRLHPDAVFLIDLKGTATAQFGLHMNTADIAVSARPIYPYEYYGIYRRSQLLPREVPVAIGGIRDVGKSTAVGVFVHRDNPLAGLSVEQLDGIFGGARTGGWQGMEWVTTVARGADRDIRTWGRLGLVGDWAAAPINVYGPPGVHPGGVSWFQSRVFGGADTWNERLREYPDRPAMLAAMAGDRHAIGYAALSYPAPGLRPLAISERTGGSFVRPVAANVADFTYPLSRIGYMYMAPDTVTGDPAPLSDLVRAFVTYVLSPAGQRLVAAATGYFPLTPALIARGRAALA